jgi:hypothetical protein
MRSLASTTCAARPPARRAAGRFRPSATAPTTWHFRPAEPWVTAPGRHPGLGGGQDDDALGLAGVDDADVVGVGGVAGAADDVRGLEVGDLRADLVLHLDLVAVGEDRDARALLALVGLHQFRDDDEDLIGPAENDGVILLDDERPSFSEVLEFRVETGRQHTDE